MSNPTQPSRATNITYDPLPLTNDDHTGDVLYNAPISPGAHQTSFNTSRYDPDPDTRDFSIPDDSSIPAGAAQPRFLGKALYDEGGPSIRNSYASSQNTHDSPVASEYGSGSVYALNDPRGATPVGGYRDDPHDSYYEEQGSVPMSEVGDSSKRPRFLEEKNAVYAAPNKSKRKIFVLAAVAGLVLIIIAVVVPVYFAVVKPNSKTASDLATDHSASASSSGASAKASATASAKTPTVAVVTGGDGSTITMEDGTTFTYSNPFGGTWYWDANDPFNNGARAQSWSPALNETFNYGVDRIRGVNLGGWLVPEPFIVPSLFEPYVNNTTPAVDEWTLCENMAADTARGGLTQLETHYKTFITEQDFAQIAGAGLNFVRIPIAYWAIETRAGEPFLAKTSWTYFLKAIQWARKYGIRINLDFHALPGSQNGWNHSGRLGTINVLNGPMGLANAQRSLDYIRILAEFISQPQYSDVVAMFGITNEPQGSTVGQDALSRYYLQAYEIVRTASGIGKGNGPFISYHDGFFSRNDWAGFLPQADRISLDSHPYLCFTTQSTAAMSTYADTPCSAWGASVNKSMSAFGMSTAGEFSNAVTDCGLWVNGVGQGVRYDGTYVAGSFPDLGSCTPWTDWQNYNSGMKTAIKNFALASMDALQNYFFWTWKVGNSSVTGKVEAPAWSYKLGLDNGWMPTDPREADGQCSNANPWQPPLSAWQTGGAGAGSIPASVSSSLAWPPPVISNGGSASLLPVYTPTGTIPTLPGPSFTATSGATITATASVGNGWENPSDNAGLMVNIATCSYLDPWVDTASDPPSPLCSAGTTKKRNVIVKKQPEFDVVANPLITPPPSVA